VKAHQLTKEVVFFVNNESATKAIARRLSRFLTRREVIALSGDLGSGKTFFARSLIQSCTSNNEEVLSPTFSLVQTYETSLGLVSHFDLYRIKKPEEVLEIGFDDAVADGIVLIEWPSQLGVLLPVNRIEIDIKHGNTETSRQLKFCGYGCRAVRILDTFDDGATYG